jgi:hypothetical protein
MRPASPPPASALLFALALLLTPALAGVAVASPAPIPVCGLCDRPLESTAQTEGVPLDVERSVATMRVHENGSATWTVRNRIGNETTAQRLRASDALTEDLVRKALETRGLSSLDPVFLDARVTENGTLVARYRTPEVATWTNGVLRVDYFRDNPGGYVYTDLGADRLTVVGPADTVVTSGLPGASVEGNRLTLTSFESSGDGPFLVFAPEDESFTGVSTFLATAGPVAPTVLGNLALFVVLPAVVLAGLVFGTSRLVDRLVGASSVDRARRYGAVVAVLALLAVFHPLYADPAPLLGSYDPPLLAGAIAAFVVAAVAAVRPRTLTLRWQFVTVGVGIALGGLAVVVAPGVIPGTYAAGDVLEPTLIGGLPLLAVPIGHGMRHADQGRRRRLLALPPLAIALGALSTASLTAANRMLMLAVVIIVGFSVVVTVLASPLLALGMALPAAGCEAGKRTIGSRTHDASE